MNALDRLARTISPTWALKREVARSRLQLLEQARDRARRYEGADRGRRTQGWVTVDSSPTAATRGALHDLRSRCRDLRRNNAWAGTAIRELGANIAGPGIRPKFTHESDGELKRATELWEEWAGTTQADAAGRETFFGLQAAAVEAFADGGEVLVRRRLRRAEDPLAVPLQVQMLEADHIDTLKDYETDVNGNKVVQGVAFDAIGRRVGYWLFREHPGDQFSSAIWAPSVFVPASELRSLYRSERPGQVRGVPWGAPIILRLHDFDAYEDNEQLRMLAATAFSGFVQDMAGADSSFTDGVLPGAAALTAKNDLLQPTDQLEGGTFEFLPAGKTITFPTPPQNEGFAAFSTVQLRAVAKGFGIPYWLLTGDLGSVNFSSIRADWISFSRNLNTWRARILVPHLCEPVLRWWREAAELVDLLTPGRVASERLRWEWIPPRREMIDPATEVTAEVESVRAGFKSLSDVVQGLGSDPQRVLEALAQDLANAKKLGLVLSVDGAQPAPGRAQTTNQAAANSPANANGKAAEARETRLSLELVERLQKRGLSLAESLDLIVGA